MSVKRLPNSPAIRPERRIRVSFHDLVICSENTLSAFLDHGVVKEALTGDALEYHKVINELRGIGIDINDVCRKLLEDGVEAFEESFNSLLNSIEEKSKAL